MDSLTLVLSSQRSGSTLLCRDIASLGGLGAPREYFLDYFDRGGGPVGDEADVLERIALGVRDGDPGVGAVKLMVGQAPAVASALNGGRAGGPAPSLRTVVDWARGRFERVAVVVLVRNAVDQAISRAVAAETRVFHSDAGGTSAGSTPVDVAPERLNPRILHHLLPVLRQRQVLLDVAAELGEAALVLSYDDLTQRVDATTRRLIDHARAQGFAPREVAVTRTLSKVIGSDDAAALRSSFLDYLAVETGMSHPASTL